MAQTPEGRAASLLTDAFDIFNEAQAAGLKPTPSGEMRKLFIGAMQVLTIWAAAADGELSIAEEVALSHILWPNKSMVDNALWQDQRFADVLMNSRNLIRSAAKIVRSYAVLKGQTIGPEDNPICRAVEMVIQTVIAADAGKEPEVARLTELMEDLRGAAGPPRPSALDPAPREGATSPAAAPAAAATPAPDGVEPILRELDALVGLPSVKHQVRTLTNLAKVFALRREMGLAVPTMSFHLVFLGNPGTGKTTVARIIAQLYGRLGLLSKGQLIEVDRGGLVANYIGQTATKTEAVIAKALGGVLFIDEAYALDGAHATDFGHEAVATLLKGMEDHRDDLVVIAAGYLTEMHRFLAMNPGLRSRMSRDLMFEDYTPAEMVAIFTGMAGQAGYTLPADAEPVLLARFQRLWDERTKDFANARDVRNVRNVFEEVISVQANRLSGIADPTPAQVQAITVEDLGAGSPQLA